MRTYADSSGIFCRALAFCAGEGSGDLCEYIGHGIAVPLRKHVLGFHHFPVERLQGKRIKIMLWVKKG